MGIIELATIGGTGLAVVPALVGVAYAAGRLTQRVAQVERSVDDSRGEIREGFAAMRAEMQELRAQMSRPTGPW